MSQFSHLQSRMAIGPVLNSMGLTGVGAEIGTAFGEHAEQVLLQSNLRVMLLVDPWSYVAGQDKIGYGDVIKNWDGCFKHCCDRLQAYCDRIVIMKTTSLLASSVIADESLDFVYLDANHMSPCIDQDLLHWFPKVRKGGVFGGHDYYDLRSDLYICDVKTAVNRFFNDKQEQLCLLPEVDSSWYAVKQ